MLERAKRRKRMINGDSLGTFMGADGRSLWKWSRKREIFTHHAIWSLQSEMGA
ncbi:hypothetical protein QG37_07230 [Candidozyma auris]|nr:hypothetical protein QG37_07230 [[Candida] auris]